MAINPHEYYKALQDEIQRQGQRFDQQQAEFTNGYNPLDFLENKEDVLSFVRSIIENTQSPLSQNMFIQNASELLLLACCFLLKETCNTTDHTLANLAKILRLGYENSLSPYKEYSQTALYFLLKPEGDRTKAHMTIQSHELFKSAIHDSLAPWDLVVYDCLLRLYSWATQFAEFKNRTDAQSFCNLDPADPIENQVPHKV